MLGKISPALIALQAALDKEQAKHLPDLIMIPAKDSLSELNKLMEQASEIIENDGEGDLPMDAKEFLVKLHSTSSTQPELHVAST